MFRLVSSATVRLSPEALLVAESFLAALPPFVQRQIRSVRLFGPQARRFDPESPFDLLVYADERNVEVKTAVAIALSAVEADGLYAANATLCTPGDLRDASGQLSRLLQNAQREGVDLWAREATLGQA